MKRLSAVLTRFIIFLTLLETNDSLSLSSSPRNTDRRNHNQVSVEGWNEISIASPPKETVDHDNVVSLGERIRNGNVVLEIPEMATTEECERIRTYCHNRIQTESDEKEINIQDSIDPQGLIRISTIAAFKRAERDGMVARCALPLSAEMDSICQKLLLRTLKWIDVEIPSIPATLFNTTSLAYLYENDQLIYTKREPAVNVYTQGGEFTAHKDAQALTVLIPLSCSRRHYLGGGTSFVVASNNVTISKPPPGHVLLFGGNVIHSGVAVQEGIRVVLVASFSPLKRTTTTGTSDSTASKERDIYGDLL